MDAKSCAVRGRCLAQVRSEARRVRLAAVSLRSAAANQCSTTNHGMDDQFGRFAPMSRQPLHARRRESQTLGPFASTAAAGCSRSSRQSPVPSSGDARIWTDFSHASPCAYACCLFRVRSVKRLMDATHSTAAGEATRMSDIWSRLARAPLHDWLDRGFVTRGEVDPDEDEECYERRYRQSTPAPFPPAAASR
jgi:hypothetical protein